ncbi:hypothetical protein BAE44_0019800 [Dichanthelium oligosanthes]|uniref:Uncharacterized protein n=1 Tax=Dichanthelium oligosanthes TaxID=888268 RepID=A0A1E5V203_9POAL|nr:hypothetical protein BAE44_0019800 [Dichanthelium oligosanthes]
MVLGGTTWWRDEEEAGGGAAATELHHQAVSEAGMLGLAVASAAIALVVSEPPPWLHWDAYFVALSGPFFVGVAQVAASVVRATTGGARRAARTSKVVYASAVALLGVAAGLALASLLIR